VKIVAFKKKHKPSDKWEREPHKVFGKPNPDIPVFTVQREDGEGRKGNLHRNLFLPKPKTSQIKPAHIDTEEESSNEEPVELVVVVPVVDSSDKPITTETTELEDPAYNAVENSASDGDALSQEGDEIYANETDSEVTCRRASIEKSDDETPEEHLVNISFSESEETV